MIKFRVGDGALGMNSRRGRRLTTRTEVARIATGQKSVTLIIA